MGEYENDTKCKIFVGNVPYQCTQEDFDECFEKIKGFVRGEIITTQKTKMSRGFGFVIMNSTESANELKKRTDITLKNRILRFTCYSSMSDSTRLSMLGDHTHQLHVQHHNYIKIDGIPYDKNREWLKNVFVEMGYGPIGRYFVCMNHNSGERKDYGMIEILDAIKLRKLVEKRVFYVEKDSVTLETSRWENRGIKNIQNKVSHYKNSKYRNTQFGTNGRYGYGYGNRKIGGKSKKMNNNGKLLTDIIDAPESDDNNSKKEHDVTKFEL